MADAEITIATHNIPPTNIYFHHGLDPGGGIPLLFAIKLGN